jgi:hypothetical protein
MDLVAANNPVAAMPTACHLGRASRGLYKTVSRRVDASHAKSAWSVTDDWVKGVTRVARALTWMGIFAGLCACKQSAMPSDAGMRGTGGVLALRDSGSAGASGMAGTTAALDAAQSTCGPCTGGLCCGVQCVNARIDFMNCGGCGQQCAEEMPYCHEGQCMPPPCNAPCDGGTCCGTSCCGSGQRCCYGLNRGGIETFTCASRTIDCPSPCVSCRCASPDTPIATPIGDRAIAELSPGDFVYSVDHRATVAVPVVRVNRVPAEGHHVLRVLLSNGHTLEISGSHPLPGGYEFADLQPGDILDGVRVVSAQWVTYKYNFTYDILPASDTGSYFAGGLLLGSTLQKQQGDPGSMLW